ARGSRGARRRARALLRGGPERTHARADRGAARVAFVGGTRALDGRVRRRAEARPGVGMKRAVGAIFLAAVLTYVFTGGGRIVGSDEVTMFELSRAITHGDIRVPEGATMRGPDGQTYSKNTWGEALLALPLVVAGDIAARAAGFQGERAQWAARFVA